MSKPNCKYREDDREVAKVPSISFGRGFAAEDGLVEDQGTEEGSGSTC